MMRILRGVCLTALILPAWQAKAFMPFMGAEGAAEKNPVKLQLECSEAIWKKDGSTSVACTIEANNQANQPVTGEFRIAPVAINGRINFEEIQFVEQGVNKPSSFLVHENTTLEPSKPKEWKMDLRLPAGSHKKNVGIQLISIFTLFEGEKKNMSTAFHLVKAP